MTLVERMGRKVWNNWIQQNRRWGYRVKFQIFCSHQISFKFFLSQGHSRKQSLPPDSSNEETLRKVLLREVWARWQEQIWLSENIYGCVFTVGQLVKNLPIMQETWIWSLGWEDPLEKGMATHSSILSWKISWTEDPGGYSPQCCKSRTQLSTLSLCLSEAPRAAPPHPTHPANREERVLPETHETWGHGEELPATGSWSHRSSCHSLRVKAGRIKEWNTSISSPPISSYAGAAHWLNPIWKQRARGRQRLEWGRGGKQKNAGMHLITSPWLFYDL